MNLRDFSCQRVNLSFAIATSSYSGLSNFSPAIEIDILDADLSSKSLHSTTLEVRSSYAVLYNHSRWLFTQRIVIRG